MWPGVQELPDFKPNFPVWSGKGLVQVVPDIGNDGCDLLQVSEWRLGPSIGKDGYLREELVQKGRGRHV